MPSTRVFWKWEEAFCKWGFGDGDGLIFTDVVAAEIETLGYRVEYDTPGVHNCYILHIETSDGTCVYGTDDHDPGYDDPHLVLPVDIVKHLDKALPPSKEMYAVDSSREPIKKGPFHVT